MTCFCFAGDVKFPSDSTQFCHNQLQENDWRRRAEFKSLEFTNEAGLVF